MAPPIFLFVEVTHIATTRIIPMHHNKGKTIAQCLHDRTSYAMNPEKTDGGELVSAYQCNPGIVESEFLFSKRQYQAFTGRKQKSDVLAYQVRQSFKPGEITPEEANRVGYEFAMRFLKGKHAFIVATHIDKKHIHNHIIWNSTALDCQRKFRDFHRSGMAVRQLSDVICLEHGLSIIEKPKRHGKSYNVWQGDSKKLSNRDRLRYAIDDALAVKPKSFDELLRFLQKAGYEIRPRGKDLSLRGPGEKGFVRLSSLKAPYTKDWLASVISGQRNHDPKKRPTITSEPPKPSLLVDIDQKLREGKGANYIRWAGNFNMKQMAQTMSYLTEHGLLAYSDLEQAAKTASERYEKLGAQIRNYEARMAEIAELRTHIINYAKTRSTYVAYRKAGYSKKFRADHESEILLHQAAKKAFDARGLKKLPTVKSLSTEYAELLAEKKKAYAEYRKARDEMRELQIHKANVEMLLGRDRSRTEQHSKEQSQR